MKKFIIILLILTAIPVLVLGYFGFIPFLAPVFKTNVPRDLGVAYTQEDADRANELVGVDRSVLPETDEKEFYFSDKTHKVQLSLTSSELSAWLNTHSWKHYPFTNLQVLLGTSGQAQISGNVDIKKLIGYFQTVGGLSESEVEAIKSKIPMVGTPAFYLNVKGNISDNQISLVINNAQVGNFPIPQNVISANTTRLIEFIEKNTLAQPSINITTLEPQDNILKVIGTLPNTEYVK